MLASIKTIIAGLQYCPFYRYPKLSDLPKFKGSDDVISKIGYLLFFYRADHILSLPIV